MDSVPFEMLDPHKLYFSTRTPWGGVPAGHVICPRAQCSHWGNLFSLLMNGTMVDTMAAAKKLTPQSCRMSEMFEFHYLKAAKVAIGWFSSFGALVCVPNLCKEGDQCHKGKSLCKPGQKYKYSGAVHWSELRIAQLNAQRIAKHGWNETELSYRSPFTRANIRPHWDKRTLHEPLKKWGQFNATHPAPPFTPLDPF